MSSRATVLINLILCLAAEGYIVTTPFGLWHNSDLLGLLIFFKVHSNGINTSMPETILQIISRNF